MHRERLVLDERVSEWLEDADVDVVETVIRQSSDDAYHCLTVAVFYKRRD